METQAPMRSVLLPAAAILAGVLLAAPGARANPPTAAVFAFQLDDTSLQGPTAADRARLGRLDTQLRDALAQSGRYAPEVARDVPDGQRAWTCDGCELDAARKM